MVTPRPTEEPPEHAGVFDVLDGLRQAHAQHDHWVVDFQRDLMCKTLDMQRIAGPEAHHNCEFGRWYDRDLHEFQLAHDKLFLAVGAAHRRFHQAARRLARAAVSRPLPVDPYNDFRCQLEEFQKTISSALTIALAMVQGMQC